MTRVGLIGIGSSMAYCSLFNDFALDLAGATQIPVARLIGARDSEWSGLGDDGRLYSSYIEDLQRCWSKPWLRQLDAIEVWANECVLRSSRRGKPGKYRRLLTRRRGFR